MPLYERLAGELHNVAWVPISKPDNKPEWILAAGRLFVRDPLCRFVRRPDLERDPSYLARNRIDPVLLWVSRVICEDLSPRAGASSPATGGSASTA